MCKVNEIEDLNTKELTLWEALAHYQQNVLYADNYPMQIESALAFLKKQGNFHC